MGTDRYAYQSRLRRISPMPKLLLTGSALVLCLLCDSVTVGLVTLLGMWRWVRNRISLCKTDRTR